MTFPTLVLSVKSWIFPDDYMKILTWSGKSDVFPDEL